MAYSSLFNFIITLLIFVFISTEMDKVLNENEENFETKKI